MRAINPKGTYFIAEIGVNHGGDIGLAKKMIHQVASAGAHAAKFQTYKAEKLAHRDSPGYWDKSEEPTASQHELFKKFDNFGREDYEILAEECEKVGIDFLSTPFDVDCLTWLMPLMPFVKIASADLTNHILLEEVAKFGKPIVLSVGASSDNEIKEVVDLLLKELQVPHLTLLHCMLHYPTAPNDAFLGRINYLNQCYSMDNISIGYSDHVKTETANNDQILLAIAQGATVIEKHFTHDKTIKGNDHYHAVNEVELKNLMDRIRLSELLLGSNDEFLDRGLKNQELSILNARRSLYYIKDIEAGSELKQGDFIAKRPGHGVSPKEIKQIIGKKLNADVFYDQPFSWDDLQNGC